MDDLEAVTAEIVVETEAVYQAGQTAASNAQTLAIIASVIAIAVAAAIAVFIAWTIKRAVKEVLSRLDSLTKVCGAGLESGIQALAQGDLTVEVTHRHPPSSPTPRTMKSARQPRPRT